MAHHNGLSFYKRKKKFNPGIIKEIFSWIILIFIAVFLATSSVYAFGMSANVVGVSMEPVLFNGQKVLINRLAYILPNPKVGDVVIFLPNGNEHSHYYVKRVAAVSGDAVQMSSGMLYVNGEKSENFNEKILDPGIFVNEITLASGEYFCVGDNVNSSEDSRSANIGPVKESEIIGKVWFCFKCEQRKMGIVR